ncbi:MAG: hypothetical protein WCQ47_02780, partial [bacterium]
MLKIIFIIFVFCVINKSFAQDTIDKICFNENNNPKNPEFEFVRDVFANTEPNGYGNLTVKIRTFLLDKPRYLLTTDLPTVTANEAIRSTLKSRIKDYISKNKLNTYQQICLIKCVVTNSLDHDKDLIGHLRPVQECYVSG